MPILMEKRMNLLNVLQWSWSIRIKEEKEMMYVVLYDVDWADVQIVVVLLQGMQSFLEIISFLGVRKSSLMFPNLPPKLNIEMWLTLVFFHLQFFVLQMASSGSRSASIVHGNQSIWHGNAENATTENRDGTTCCKLKTCCRCGPNQKMEIRVSESRNNYGRPFYKSRVCGAFSWVENDDVVTLNVNEGGIGFGGLLEEIRSMKQEVKSNGDYVNWATKIAVVMYIVLIFIVLK